jgi:hypothetical protein
MLYYEKGMKVKVPVQDALAGLAGPHPLPPLLRYAELVRGGGGGAAASGPSPAWFLVSLASLFGRQEWRLIWADQMGNLFRRVKKGGPFGRVNLASLFSGFFGKGKQSNTVEKKSKACIFIL